MKLLLLSFYYQPDLSAGSFRTTALINALLEQLPAGAHIELITTLPNRYNSYATEAPIFEEHPALVVHRIVLPVHHNGMLDQSRAFLAFAKGVLQIVKGKQYALIYATSSRLMTAALGAAIARYRRCPLYLDIRDIFVDTIKDVLPINLSRLLGPVFSLLENWTIKTASKVNLVSPGFLSYFENRYSQTRFSFFTNGIDEEFMRVQPKARLKSGNDILNVVYAGNMGEGQGLHMIIPELAKQFEGRLRFLLIGDGGRRKQLAVAVSAAGCTNVEILEPVSREKLIEIYKSADVLFLHLNDYDAFKKVLPSKLFEYAALGKPIWAGVAGFAAEFLKDHVVNSAVFPPCDVLAATRAFEELSLITEPRTAFVGKYSRANIMARMAEDILSLTEK